MIEDGTYQAVVVKNDGRWVDFGRAGKKETPKASLTFRIWGGEFEGKIIQWDGWLTTANAISRTRSSLETCGFRGPFSSMRTQTPTTEPVEIVVQTEEYEGKRRQRVAFINRGGYRISDESRMSDAELAEFDDSNQSFDQAPADDDIRF